MRLRLFCKGRPSLWLPPPIFFWSCPKENGPWTVQKKKRYDEQEDRSVLLFVVTGVVRIGAAEIGGPVVPASNPGRRKAASPHSMVRQMVGAVDWIGVFLLPRGPLRYALPRRSMWDLPWSLPHFPASVGQDPCVLQPPGFHRPPRQRPAKQKTRKQKQIKSDVHPVYPPKAVMRQPGSSSAGCPAQGRRGPRSPPHRFARPPYSGKAPRTGRFAARRFSLPPAAAHSLWSRQKRMRGGVLREPPGLPGVRRCHSVFFSTSSTVSSRFISCCTADTPNRKLSL